MDEKKLLERITINPNIFGGKPIIRGRRLAVEHALGMLAAGDTTETHSRRLSLAGAGRCSPLSGLRALVYHNDINSCCQN